MSSSPDNSLSPITLYVQCSESIGEISSKFECSPKERGGGEGGEGEGGMI